MCWIRRRSDVLVALVLIALVSRYGEGLATRLYECNGSAMCVEVRWLVSLMTGLALVYVASRAAHRVIAGRP